MHFNLQTLIPLIFVIPLTHAIPIDTPVTTSCAATDDSVTVCAEIYNTTDCTGPATVVINTLPTTAEAVQPQCHNVYAAAGGSINVVKGEVFAGFARENCHEEWELLTGPKWKHEAQGCENITGTKMIKSWNAW